MPSTRAVQVVDASVLVEAMRLYGPLAAEAIEAMSRPGSVAPELIDIEVVQTLRRLVRIAALGLAEAEIAIIGLPNIPLARRPHSPLPVSYTHLRAHETVLDL